MRYLYSILLALSLLSFDAHAQSNYKPGYIVTLNGDTTKGFVDYKEWGKNPRQINFKTTETSAIKQYSPQNITAFGIDKIERYVRYIGPISRHEIEISRISDGIDTSVRRDSVFLRTVTSGINVTLFEYEDDIKERFFIAEKASTPVELKFYRYFAKENSMMTEAVYRQQLQRLVAAYQPQNQALIQQVQGADYALKDLAKTVLTINGLSKNADVNVSDRMASAFFIGLAANAVHFSYKSSNVSSNTSILPQLNAGVNVYFNKNVGKTLFRAEINISGNKADIKQADLNAAAITSRLVFDQFSVSLTPQLIQNIYNTSKVKAYAGIGMGLNFCAESNAKYYYGNNEITLPSDNITFISIVTKAGVALNKIDLFVGWNYPLTNIGATDGRRNSYQLGINYSLGK